VWTDISVLIEKAPPSQREVRQVFQYLARRAKARFYADENFPQRAVSLLRETGSRVDTAHEAGLVGHSDEDHAAYARRHRMVLLSCDRDFLNEQRFPLIHCPAIFVFDFGNGTTREMRQAFRCLTAVFSMPQFFDKWWKIDAKRDGWTELVRHLDGSTSRHRYRLSRGRLQEWVSRQ
jgi:predicted nuclease of predicted toxin-antitoxin system